MPSPTKSIITHPFQGEVGFWRVHNLLVETYPITPLEWNWEIRRWDGQCFQGPDRLEDPAWAERIRLWETTEGRLVGAVLPEDEGEAHLQLHPDYRQEVEGEMIAWAEDSLAIPGSGGGRELRMVVFEYDTPRRRLLQARGWEQTLEWWVARRLRLGQRRLPRPELARGYTLRSLRAGDDGEYQRLADVLNAGFGRTIHRADDSRCFMTTCPSFRYDLHLVAEAPDGSFASHVGLTYDEANYRGIFEPVCTHPAHRRQGLARALILEGLRRLQAVGAEAATVATGSAEPANALYDSIGFTEAYRGYFWQVLLP